MYTLVTLILASLHAVNFLRCPCVKSHINVSICAPVRMHVLLPSGLISDEGRRRDDEMGRGPRNVTADRWRRGERLVACIRAAPCVVYPHQASLRDVPFCLISHVEWPADGMRRDGRKPR